MTLGVRVKVRVRVKCWCWYSDNYRYSASYELNTICHVEKSTFTSKLFYIYVQRRITTEKRLHVRLRGWPYLYIVYFTFMTPGLLKCIFYLQKFE